MFLPLLPLVLLPTSILLALLFVTFLFPNNDKDLQ